MSLPLPQDLRIDQVFLAVAGGSRAQLLRLIKLCEDQNLEFKIVPDLLDVISTRVDVDAIDGVPLVGIRHNQLRGANAGVKRVIDVAAVRGLSGKRRLERGQRRGAHQDHIAGWADRVQTRAHRHA
jgi:hypothetical protein